MKKEESKAFSFDFIGGKNVMPIMAFYGPMYHYWAEEIDEADPAPDFISDEYFKIIKESGINVVMYSHVYYNEHPHLTLKSLDLAGEYGLGYLVMDTELLKYTTGEKEPNVKELAHQVSHYTGHPACCGMYVVDEPCSCTYHPLQKEKLIPKYKELMRMLEEIRVTNVQSFLPIVNYKIPGMKERYRQYIEEYYEVFKPKILNYDFYVFTDQGAPEIDAYFWNMCVVREYAQKYQVPFGTCIQAGGQWNDHLAHFDSVPYYPNEGQFYWNVNTCLAFGAKAITYFPLIQPHHFAWAESTKWDFDRNGLLGLDGRKTQWYYYAQNINRQIEAIDEVLMNSVNKGVIASGEKVKEDLHLTDCVIETGNFEQLIGVTGEALVGCFNYEGRTALYVVNYDMEKGQNITLHFDDIYNLDVIQNAERIYAQTTELTLNMAAGEGVLVVVK